MSTESLIHFSSLELFDKPFPYFTAAEGFGEPLSSTILGWLETEAPWTLVEADFYEQYEFTLLDIPLPPPLAFLSEPSFLKEIRLKVERTFEVRLSMRIDCTVHKLVHGQRIRIHNDFIPGEETHRLLIQLNRGWDDDQGGFLMLFNSEDPSDMHRVISPVHDSVVGFAISKDSNHAVSTIHGGERFTIVFSFFGEEDD